MAASRSVEPIVPFGGRPDDQAGDLLGAPLRWSDPAALRNALTTIRGVGPVFGDLAAEAGVETVFDLLWRIPGQYEEPPPEGLLERLEEGVATAVEVEVVDRRRVRPGRRAVVEATVRDSGGTVRAVWFNRPWVYDRIAPGDRLVLEGRLSGESFVVATHRSVDSPGDSGPRPRYRSSGDLGPGRWSGWAAAALDRAEFAAEPLPATVTSSLGLPSTAAALREVHRPRSAETAELARRRLAFEELFLHQVMVTARRRRERQEEGPALALGSDPEAEGAWIESLPFDLTGDQREVIGTLGEELAAGEPMRRLLMGEVGSGKTVIAAFGILRAVRGGGQAALMAPTELLAEQHHATLSSLLESAGIEPVLLTGSTDPAERARLFERLARGEPVAVVGTHALLSEGVEFERLALAVVDEEHRFGVRQRTQLAGRDPDGPSVHRLHLSATPIPRTLALTAWGDLDVSELRELPGGRRPVATRLIDDRTRDEAFTAVREEVAAGRQAFVVCPLVEESEAIEAKAAEAEAERLAEAELSGLDVGLVHGRIEREERERTMKRFAAGEIDVLVATTVIEVGIDVPNATVIVIEGAESFGLAQLHQLRGRVGRGSAPGTCFLIPGRSGSRSIERLSRLAGETDGFRVAELDLELRGEGELAGTRQHGLPRFRVARLPEDRELLFTARKTLDRLLGEGDGLEGPLLAPSLEEALVRFGPAGLAGPAASDDREDSR